MRWIVKPTITCILWKVLEEKLGLKVGGMLNVDRGWVDLVAKDPTGEYVGLEVKDFSEICGESKKEIEFVDQILKYMTSGYFDCFHVCVPTEDVQNLKLTLDPRRYLNPIYRFNYPNEYERFRKCGGYLDHCGILSIPLQMIIKELNVDFPDLIERYPKRLTRHREPQIPKANKARTRFNVWNHFTKIKNAYPICAGVLPNLEGKKPRQIDVLVFMGNTSPYEILKNQEKFDLIGIETQSDLDDVNQIEKELNLYLNSGGVTKLYLAVPFELEEKALSLLDDIPDVGLFFMDRGSIRTKKEAKKLEMQYDSILFEQAGFQANLGHRTEVSHRIIEIGWGGDAKEHKSTYRYLGKATLTDKQAFSKIKQNKRREDENNQTKRLDEWTK